MKHGLCTVVAILLIAIGALGQQRQQQPAKLTVGVLDFDARSPIRQEEAASLSDIFSAELVKSGEFVVVDRNRIKAILDEQGFQQTEACTQVECIVEAGKILKVRKMFAGVIGKVGRVFNVNVQVIDIETAQIQFVETRQHAGEIEDLVYEIIPDIAGKMMSQMTGKEIRPVTAQTGTSWYWYVGGAILLGGGAAAAILLRPEKKDTPADQNLPLPPPLPQP